MYLYSVIETKSCILIYHYHYSLSKLLTKGFSTFILSSLQNRYKQIKARYLFSKTKTKKKKILIFFVSSRKHLFVSGIYFFSLFLENL